MSRSEQSMPPPDESPLPLPILEEFEEGAPNVVVLKADKIARVDVSTYTLSETSGMHQHLHGTSVSGNIG